MKPSSQNPQQYRFVERGHGDITADVVEDADLGTVLWIQTSLDGCYLRPTRIDEFAAGLHSVVGEEQASELATLRRIVAEHVFNSADGALVATGEDIHREAGVSAGADRLHAALNEAGIDLSPELDALGEAEVATAFGPFDTKGGAA